MSLLLVLPHGKVVDTLGVHRFPNPTTPPPSNPPNPCSLLLFCPFFPSVARPSLCLSRVLHCPRHWSGESLTNLVNQFGLPSSLCVSKHSANGGCILPNPQGNLGCPGLPVGPGYSPQPSTRQAPSFCLWHVLGVCRGVGVSAASSLASFGEGRRKIHRESDAVPCNDQRSSRAGRCK